MDQRDFAKLFKILAAKHDQNPEFRFVPRTKKDKKGRLDQGFLLGGNSNYITVGLVRSSCKLSKICSVHFNWTPEKCYITLLWRAGDDIRIKSLIDLINEKMPGSNNSTRNQQEDSFRDFSVCHEGLSMEEAVNRLEKFCIDTLYPAIRELGFDSLLDFPEKVERRINEGKRRVEGIINGTDVVEIPDNEEDEEQDTEEHVVEKTYDLNMILYGPPGTGKTYNTVFHAVAICDEKNVKEVEDEGFENAKSRYDSLMREGRIAFTTFHQSYGYEEFIEGIKPVVDNTAAAQNDGVKANDATGLKYKIEDGVFKKFCKAAGDKPKVFIIDEINRGNISKIFGELITLIEYDKRLGMCEGKTAVLPYSGESFGVPSNVYILGTMNTADRSIALMDTALRRRFRFVEKMPKSNLVDFNVTYQEKSANIKSILDKINERIEYLYDREHTIGHAFFISLKKLEETKRFGELAGVFKNKIIPLLQEYFYEDYEKIRLVLGDNAKDEDNQFVLCENKIAKEVFRISKPSDDDRFPEEKKIYSINSEAFENIDSYIGIYENARQN